MHLRVNEDCRNGEDHGSLEIESRSGLLLQNHCCQLSPSSAFDAVKAVTALGAKSVNRYFLNNLFGVLSDEGRRGRNFQKFLGGQIFANIVLEHAQAVPSAIGHETPVIALTD
jgi:hypothetical protein